MGDDVNFLLAENVAGAVTGIVGAAAGVIVDDFLGVDAFFDAFERMQDLNANRAMGNMAPLIVPLEGRITALEQRVSQIEQRERLSGEP